MTREEKQIAIDQLAERISNAGIFYIADTSKMDAGKTSDLRRACFKSNIQMSVVKNKVLLKALEKIEGKEYSEMYEVL